MKEKEVEKLLKCPICNKKFKRISKYLYKPDCKHMKNILISVG
jgi:uncharacterized C2H2 Zn-finger protein